MTTTHEREPKHGFTKDGVPVHAKTRDYFRRDTAMQRFNAAVGLRITVLVGTMWCAYVFAGIALISLPDNVHSTQLLILWISSSFLQLVLLPVIIVGQNIQARAADARAAKTFDDVLDVRRKVEHAIHLLDVNTEGGLHDAVAIIVDAINAKGQASPAAAT
jgi:type IV secretory pathway VirB3-like protein